MEINITKFWNEAAPRDYSASRAEFGDDAGAITWRHACEDAPDFNFLDTPDKLSAFQDYLRDMGFSEADDAHTDTELNALFLQCVSGDIREVPDMDIATWNWDAYLALAENGTVSSRLFRADNGDVFYYIGS